MSYVSGVNHMNRNQIHPNTNGDRMKIVLIKDHQKKVLEKEISPFEKRVGIVSLEKIEDGTEFTIRILGVHHIRYRYNPKTQKFEVHFLSLKKEEKRKDAQNHEKIHTRF